MWSGLAIVVGVVIYAVVMTVAKRVSVYHNNNLEQAARRAGRKLGAGSDLKASTQKARSTYAGLVKSVVRLCFVVAVALAILSINGVDVGSVLAGLGILSVVLGLAVQDALKDAIRGITIIAEKYFQVGDIVTVNGTTGKVISIGILTTKMTDSDNGDAVVSIANRNIVDASVHTTSYSVSVDLEHIMPQVELARYLTDAAMLIEQDEKVKTCTYLGATKINGNKISHTFKLTCSPKQRGAAKRAVYKQVLATLEEHRIPLASADD